MKRTLSFLLLLLVFNLPSSAEGPVRVLFLGHESEHHNANRFHPLLAKTLGPDAIYFDYVTTIDEALGDPEHLARFDALLLYANHRLIKTVHWNTLRDYVENGGGFVPVHCASACFINEPGFAKLVGGKFQSHKGAVFTPKTIRPEHPAIAGETDAPELTAWDETYRHSDHHETDRTVLQVREVTGPDDNISDPEPWTWVRTQGDGRVFYTASGHDERVWNEPAFHDLLRRGILWSIGDQRRAAYQRWLADRPPLAYEDRGNVPNYEKRPEPLPYQLPLPPETSLDYTRVPVGFRLELFASEPDIVNPTAITWDERGRLWVAETRDYPNELTADRTGRDRIKILEDTDGDGRCDKVTVFADNLNVPTALVHANGGLLVAHAPDFLFLEDTDGDDRADVRQVINTGWGINDTHAGPSNLRYGFDNRVWGAVGYSGYNGPTTESDNQRFGSGIFAMDPDGGAITFLHQFNNNTWGLGFNAAGDVFGSTANNNPAFFCGLPATVGRGKRVTSARAIADSRDIHPITPNIRQADLFGKYTAAAGFTLATSPNFPPAWRDRMAFVSAPTGNLLGMFDTQPDAAGYRAHNRFALVASADEWFSPVAAEIGPDGNLWIADWYNFIIQHNPTPRPERGGYQAVNGKGNAHVNPNRDRDHGRIYKLVWDDAPEPTTRTLAGASPETLIDTLADKNLFWRLTAQRLLVEARSNALDPALRDRVRAGGLAARHALWTLHGLGALDAETHQFALLSPDPVLKRNAIRALGTDAKSQQLLFDTAVVTDNDPHVRREAFTRLALFPQSELLTRAASWLATRPENRDAPWLADALKAAGATEGEVIRELGPNLLPNPGFEDGAEKSPADWRPVTYNKRDATFSWVGGRRLVRTGKKALRISSEKGADVSWSANVPCKPNTDYVLSGWVKTIGVRGAMGGLFNIHALGDTRTKAITRDTDWTELTLEFNSGNRRELQFNCLYGGWGQSTGDVVFDDVSLREVTKRIVLAPEEPITGDVARGKEIFNQHPVAGCLRCHQVDGQGGVIGPALDGIASRKTRDYLLQSLVDPQATIADGYPAQVSPMPPMGVLLKEQELADVMAYLMTLTVD